MQQARP